MSNSRLQNDAPHSHHTNIISELVKGKLVPGPIWQKREYRLKFLLRSLLFWSSTHRMLDALARREIEAAARQVATVTALVPMALADVATARKLGLHAPKYPPKLESA